MSYHPFGTVLAAQYLIRCWTLGQVHEIHITFFNPSVYSQLSLLTGQSFMRYFDSSPPFQRWVWMPATTKSQRDGCKSVWCILMLYDSTLMMLILPICMDVIIWGVFEKWYRRDACTISNLSILTYSPSVILRKKTPCTSVLKKVTARTVWIHWNFMWYIILGRMEIFSVELRYARCSKTL